MGGGLASPSTCLPLRPPNRNHVWPGTHKDRSVSTRAIRIGNAEMSQALSNPIRQGTDRCFLFGGNFAVLQFLCNPDAFWSVVSYSCSSDFPFSWLS